jgi:glutamate racemase
MTGEEVHLLITDSGVGGLSVCAEVENELRQSTTVGSARITYFNAWPDAVNGYNDLPDVAAQASVFDRALTSMAARRPDRIVIACNTLSVVYGQTAFERDPSVPVLGIVDAGVEMFYEALAADDSTSIALFGTRTTIESSVHRDKLVEKGIAAGRITATSCHGLARAIETNPDGAAVSELIEECAARASQAGPTGDPLYLGVCCTHYTYVREAMRSALERHCARPVHVLDPGRRLVADLLAETETRRVNPAGPEAEAPRSPPGVSSSELGPSAFKLGAITFRLAARVSVTVLSKVALDETKRRLMAARLEQVSPATATALLNYTHVPDLF